MNLVDGQDRGGGVIERRRESLGGDVDDDPKDEGRVLPHGPVVADADRVSQDPSRQARAAGVDPEQGIPGRHEVADLGDQIDEAVGAPGKGLEAGEVEGQHDAVDRIRDYPGGLRVEGRAWVIPRGTLAAQLIGVRRKRRAARVGVIDRSIQDVSSRPDILCTSVTLDS